MISQVIEQYLDSISDERDFDLPFMTLIYQMGFYDIHWTHGKWEYGKDFIAKLDVNGQPIQYVFQSKAGNISLTKWRTDIAPQLQEAITNTLSHPNFDSTLPRQVVFIDTGDLVGGAINAAQNWNNDFVPNTLKAKPVEFWCKPQLVKNIEQYALNSVYRSTALKATSHANFLSFYSNCLSGTITTRGIESYSLCWLDPLLSVPERIIRATIEAEIFARVLLQNGQIYEAIVCYLAIARTIFHSSYQQPSTQELDLLKQHFELAKVRIKSLSIAYLRFVETEWNKNGNDLVSAGFGGMFTYLVHICRIFDTMCLAYFINPTTVEQTSILSFLRGLKANEQGVGKVPSDLYAVSLTTPIMIAVHQGEINLAKEIIENAVNWLIDRVANGNSIANLNANEEEEVNTLFGVSNLNVATRPGGGFSRVILTDLAALTNDSSFYDSIGQLLKTTVIPSYRQVQDTEGITMIEGSDIVDYPNLEIKEKLSAFDDLNHGEHIENDIDQISLADEFGLEGLLVLSLLLRDRYFPRKWRTVLDNTTAQIQAAAA